MFTHLLYLWSCNLGSKSQLSVNILGPRGSISTKNTTTSFVMQVPWNNMNLNKLIEAFNCVRGAVQWRPNFQSPTKPSAAETCKLNWFSNAVFDLEPTKWIHKKVQNIAVSSTRNSSSTARVSCKFKRFLQASNSFIRSLLRCTTGAFDYSYTPQYSMDHDIVCITTTPYFHY